MQSIGSCDALLFLSMLAIAIFHANTLVASFGTDAEIESDRTGGLYSRSAVGDDSLTVDTIASAATFSDGLDLQDTSIACKVEGSSSHILLVTGPTGGESLALLRVG